MACEPPPKRSKKEVTEHGGDILESYMAKRKEVCKSVTDFKFNKKRVRLISSDADIPENCKGIAYWMWREQRVQGWFKPPVGGGGGTLGISGWGCAAGSLEPLTFTRASSAEFCYPILE